MKILMEQTVGEIIEKKSRFIATVEPVSSKEEAEQFIAACKKKYWDAKHNCSAYVIGSSNEIMHSSDDGEPSGTAGRPILSVLTGQEIHNVAVVVTRYFGGVLLGTGGLVRAYQGAVTEALSHAVIKEQIDVMEITVELEYGDVGAVQHYLSQHDEHHLNNSEYGARVSFHVLVPVEQTETFLQDLTQLTNGKAKLNKGNVRPF